MASLFDVYSPWTSYFLHLPIHQGEIMKLPKRNIVLPLAFRYSNRESDIPQTPSGYTKFDGPFDNSILKNSRCHGYGRSLDKTSYLTNLL